MASSRDTRRRKRRRRGILRHATAGVVPVALAGSAQAIPVATEFPVPITLSSGQTLPLDVNQDGVDDIAIAVSAGPAPISISLDFLAPQTGAVPGRLDAGASVGPASSFSLIGFDLLAGLPGGPVSGTWSVTPPQPPFIDGFLGVAAPFAPPQPPFAPEYGWVHLSLDLENASVTVDRFGYETEPGVPILTGVPEPASASLLAFGLAFLRRFTAVRRERK